MLCPILELKIVLKNFFDLLAIIFNVGFYGCELGVREGKFISDEWTFWELFWVEDCEVAEVEEGEL